VTVTGNLLFDSLPKPVRTVCLQVAERDDVGFGEEIFRENDLVSHAFFPANSVCSITVRLKSGNKAEVALIGREGFIGVSLLHGPRTSWFGATVQAPGFGYRIPLPLLADLFNRNAAFREAMLLYSWYLFNVLARSGPCNGSHSIRERLARWLLTAQDCAGKAVFPFTHHGVSEMLAAARPSLSLAAAKLKSMRCIDYRRGKVAILNRRKLEEMTCECYETTKRFQQFLPWLRTKPVL
jgi:CRP-like cAMP-binding protein